jgi:hypothetical protein
MKKLLLFCCLIMLITACKKEDEKPIKLTGTYEGDHLRRFESVKIYTAKNTITDTAFIKDFAARRMGDYGWVYNFFTVTSGKQDSMYRTIHMEFNEDSVTILNDPINYYDTSKCTITYKNRNTVLLTYLNPSYVTSALDGGEFGCSNVDMYLRKYQPTFTCNNGCVGFQQAPFIIRNNYLSFTSFSYYFCRPIPIVGYGACSASKPFVFDFLNENIISQLQPNDTLLIMTSSIRAYKI